MGAHQIAALSARVPTLWPPGPYALASAAARIAEAVCLGSRRQYSCFVDVGRGRIAAMPVELRRGGINRIIEPFLTAQERTALDNATYT
jgi:malate/lactate dehydrogenase